MAKKSNEKAVKPVKTRKRKESVELDASDLSSETPISEVTSSTPSKKELRAAAKVQKKAGKPGKTNSSAIDEELDPAEVLPKLPKEKRLKGPLLNLAVLTFLFAIIVSMISIFMPFKEVVSVSSDVIGTFSVEVTIQTPQFITAPAASACKGSGRLAGLPSAILRLEAADGSWKVNSPLGTGQLNTEGNCIYMPEIETPEAFDGGSVEARVDFGFGSSETFNVDGNSIKLEINLGI